MGNLVAADNNTNLVRFLVSLPATTCARLPYGMDLQYLASWTRLTSARDKQALTNTYERVIQTPDSGEPSVEVPLGLYMVRGDNVCTVGLVDEKLDSDINWSEVKGSAIGGTKHI